ncbi:MAG: hypothetical protein NT175_08660 [Bacteroidetes bacterium]|nr:hypothetical protein [Bacteroidota bacterium]
MKLFTSTMFLITFLLLVVTGCSSRIDVPVTVADSTIVYPAKKADGISAKITLCRKISKKTGNRIDAGTVFTIKEKESIYAFVDLENCFVHGVRTLMFHLDWIDTSGRSFYRKRIDLSPDDTTTTLNSSISISPDKRQPGEYLLRVYLFRELIAEKKFELRPESQVTPSQVEEINAKIILCRNVDKKTGRRIRVDSVFTIREKESIYAFVDFENRFVHSDRELMFHIDWIDTSGTSFYQKGINLSPGDSSSTINSSISISPNKRQPGEYFFKIYLFDELIAEKKFELRPESQVTPSHVEGIQARIILCRNVDKETGKRTGVDSVFTIKEKEKIRAFIDLVNRRVYGDRELILLLDWIGPNGRSFYRKQVDLSPGDSSSTINSSISISPDKRQPGEYLLRIYLYDELIGEKKFELRSESQVTPSKDE